MSSLQLYDQLIQMWLYLIGPHVHHLLRPFCYRYEELPDGSLLLHLTGQEPVRTQLLVGADGYFSRVRQQCLGDGPPTFNDRAMWRGRIKEECAVACGVSAGTSAMYQGDYRVAMCFPISGGEVVWTAFAPGESWRS